VWNRQRKDEVLLDVHDVALGHTTKMRWNDRGKWIYSEETVHPPIIDDIAAALHRAEPGDTASAYRQLGLRLTYHPEQQLVSAAACPKPRDIGNWFVSEGGLEPPCP
jgi:site-specific DNA recombinase